MAGTAAATSASTALAIAAANVAATPSGSWVAAVTANATGLVAATPSATSALLVTLRAAATIAATPLIIGTGTGSGSATGAVSAILAASSAAAATSSGVFSIPGLAGLQTTYGSQFVDVVTYPATATLPPLTVVTMANGSLLVSATPTVASSVQQSGYTGFVAFAGSGAAIGSGASTARDGVSFTGTLAADADNPLSQSDAISAFAAAAIAFASTDTIGTAKITGRHRLAGQRNLTVHMTGVFIPKRS